MSEARLDKLCFQICNAPSINPEDRQAVIIAGVRTPFVKSFGKLMHCDSIELGAAVVKGLIQKTRLDPGLIDEVIMGNVVVKSSAPNLAREIVLDLGLPPHVPGVTCSRACLSGLQAIEQGVCLIESGNASVVIAGGSDSLSSGELPMPKDLTLALGKYSMGGGNKNGLAGIRELLSIAGPVSNWIPTKTEIAERSTGKTMGYHADLIAEINKISREDQDKFASESHKKAFAAAKAGYFKDEIIPVNVKKTRIVVDADDLIRESVDPKKISGLNPAFRNTADKGTVTAASSSPLTDGASAVLIMSKSKAKSLGYPTDTRLRCFINTAIDPFPQLLLAPALAIPKALAKAGLQLSDIDLFEFHEAFAAQVLCTLKCLEDEEFCKKFCKLPGALGKIDPSKLNINGGSIAIGHPFAATGGRIITSAMNELRRSKKKYCLISICAAGGLGGVAILERAE